MAYQDVYRDSDSGFMGGAEMHPEKWRTYGNEAQMIDVSEHGPLSPAEDDMLQNTRPPEPEWPNAPGFIGGKGGAPDPGELSGALDGEKRK